MSEMRVTLFYDDKAMEDKYWNRLLDSFNKINREFDAERGTFTSCGELDKYLGIETTWLNAIGEEASESTLLIYGEYEGNCLELILDAEFTTGINAICWLDEISKKYRCKYAFIMKDYYGCYKSNPSKERVFYKQKYFFSANTYQTGEDKIPAQYEDEFFMDEAEALEAFKPYCPNAKSIKDINKYLSKLKGYPEIIEVLDYGDYSY